MSNPVVSVIIPCYNQGMLLKEALDSLQKCDNSLFEVIVVNDGSSDEFTNTYMSELSSKGYYVINQENQGLGQARNNAIKASKGKFILPLDADNKIHPSYITKGVKILEENDSIAVVYGNARYFGEKHGILKPGPFNLQRLMLGNYIDACALIRRTVLEQVGYYSYMTVMGLEDWDLWLKIAFKDHGFYYLDEILFDYRVTSGSMLRSLNSNIEKQNAIENYFKEKYADKLDFNFVKNYFIGKMKRAPIKFIYRLILEKYFPNHYKKLIRTNKIYSGWLYDRS